MPTLFTPSFVHLFALLTLPPTGVLKNIDDRPINNTAFWHNAMRQYCLSRHASGLLNNMYFSRLFSSLVDGIRVEIWIKYGERVW